VEYGCAYGTVILKPNGAGIDLYKPGEFEITHHKDGKIDGIVFTDSVEVGDKWYTKLEYHRFLSIYDTYVESNNSGMASIGESGVAGKGSLLAGALEMSNVDLSEQMTDMIVTQRGFQSNAKTIQTADTLLETVLSLKR
jgi:flagellar basal body rod protein FlgG